jgi:S-adenosyl-L-methionine hydrolase (adenosine-forming)
MTRPVTPARDQVPQSLLMAAAERPAAVSEAGPGTSPVITLLTDFGHRDYYVGAVKGVMLRHAPDAMLVDITHDIPPQDVLSGAFVLQLASREFPPGTIHLAVVDPGVGTERRALAVQTRGSVYVAPDNGLLSLVINSGSRVRCVTHPALRAAAVSDTFHGRDLFAPAAAQLAAGFPFDQVGPLIHDPVDLAPLPATVTPGIVTGQIIYVDGFGNLVTNIDAASVGALGPQVSVHLPDGTALYGLSRTYADVVHGELLALLGSAGLLEISARNGSARTILGLGRGDTVRVERR